MLSRPLVSTVALFICIVGFNSASAQNMRVYTSVSEVSKPASPRVISRSLTLFHAGKVYDYMEDSGEVVIFEPVHHRFVIISKSSTATEVPFSEINHHLESAKLESLSYLDRLKPLENPKDARLQALVRFQLSPEFNETKDTDKNLIEMKSEHLNYQVKTAKIDTPQLARQYLDYTDWAARLNFVMRPNSTYPEARLKLNETLRRDDLLPTQVDLELMMAEPVKLRADHQFSWEFLSADRTQINKWEQLIKSNDIRWMPLKQYIEQSVAHKSR
ncbi:hypothetical protein SH668x_000855 [Planctomicrobium sp. SH668]|uniref:hypothetical protein n=1 Tax=Planctomicrobium sp. SH668 TaxID=3448126 RepID=UPI003F5C84B3